MTSPVMTPPANRQFLTVSWITLGFAGFIVLRLWFIGPSLLGDPDVFLHIAIGDWIRAHGTVPQVDPFSYPMAGQPWVAHEWLSGLIFSYLYELTGWYGICALAVILFGVTLAVLANYLVRYLPPLYVIFLLVLAAAGLETHLLARPHVLAWPLMALWISQLLVRSDAGRQPQFWLLPLMVLWANLHGGFTLGLAFIPFLALESWQNSQKSERHRVLLGWAMFFLLSLMCALLTPYGWAGLGFTGNLISINSIATITEWRPISVGQHPLVLFWMGALLVLGLRGWLRLPWIRLVLLLGLGWQMMLHGRFYSIFALLSPMLIAGPLAESRKTWAIRGQQSADVEYPFPALAGLSDAWAKWLAIGLMVVVAIWARQPDLSPTDEYAPRGAVSYLKIAGIAGHGLNYYDYGGYLIWSGVPVFMDGRVDLRGDAGMKAYQDAVTQPLSVGLTQLIEKYQIAWTIFPKDHVGALHMDRERGWRRLYEDDLVVIHGR